jgi:hypothetical protein
MLVDVCGGGFALGHCYPRDFREARTKRLCDPKERQMRTAMYSAHLDTIRVIASITIEYHRPNTPSPPSTPPLTTASARDTTTPIVSLLTYLTNPCQLPERQEQYVAPRVNIAWLGSLPTYLSSGPPPDRKQVIKAIYLRNRLEVLPAQLQGQGSKGTYRSSHGPILASIHVHHTSWPLLSRTFPKR